MRLSSERKHLSNVLKTLAYQIEGNLVETLRPAYPRTDAEVRTMIQTALRSASTIEPTAAELRVTLAPLSSPQPSRAIAAVGDALNKKTDSTFPGTNLRLRYAVAQSSISSKSGQVSADKFFVFGMTDSLGISGSVRRSTGFLTSPVNFPRQKQRSLSTSPINIISGFR